MKSILLKILSIISPVIILAVLGIMQGIWFDVEESIERGDTEVYHPSSIQYLLYYLVSIVLFVLSWIASLNTFLFLPVICLLKPNFFIAVINNCSSLSFK